MRHTTIAAAFAAWAEEIKPEVIRAYGADDGPALAESWNDYTDTLCKDGAFNDLQYRHCPAWDDDMPDDDAEFLLEAMGVSLRLNSDGSALIMRSNKGGTVTYPLPEDAACACTCDVDLFAAVLLECEAADDDAPLLPLFTASELSDLREVFEDR